MDFIQKLEESMKVLDILSVFLNEESDNCIKSEEIRILLEEVFEKIHEIYESLGDDDLIEELRNKWEENDDESSGGNGKIYDLAEKRKEKK